MPTLIPAQLLRVGAERQAWCGADDCWLVLALLVWSPTAGLGG